MTAPYQASAVATAFHAEADSLDQLPRHLGSSGAWSPGGKQAEELRLFPMDAVLQSVASHPLPPRPPAGWLRSIREALGMTSAVLTERPWRDGFWGAPAGAGRAVAAAFQPHHGA